MAGTTVAAGESKAQPPLLGTLGERSSGANLFALNIVACETLTASSSLVVTATTNGFALGLDAAGTIRIGNLVSRALCATRATSSPTDEALGTGLAV